MYLVGHTNYGDAITALLTNTLTHSVYPVDVEITRRGSDCYTTYDRLELTVTAVDKDAAIEAGYRAAIDVMSKAGFSEAPLTGNGGGPVRLREWQFRVSKVTVW